MNSDNDKPVPITYSDQLNSSLAPPPLDPSLLTVANDYLAGQSIDEIAKNHSLTMDQVTSIIENKDIKSYVDNVFLSQGYLNRAKRLAVINKVIDEKLQEAFESGVYTKKDLLDWMKLLNDMETNARPKREVGVAVQINNNYDSLMKDLLGDKK
jgi:hypothetical protein